MSFRKYITSKVFFTQVLIALGIVAAVSYAFFHWITFATNHGEEIPVPNLAKLSAEQAEERLAELDLDYIILDTVDYNPDFPKLTIVDQDPKPGRKVKAGRKIYLKINAEKFTMVTVPDLIEKTYRQAVPTLNAVGLNEGTITYKPYLGKDMVLEMQFNGKKLKPGDKVLKSSKIDLVLGDGKVVFDASELDTLKVDTPDAE
ncbi:PASTA domain-containing protein [Flavobacterium capsici]|uniref:PASTA domain-containing protein n=1 Tax=Flavobacterium capsici TaxID=3075618 RepID=A0AA96EYZ2_9FLAO|nr:MULTISPECIES: PASTA domain-containing protein [unclassified Flavobacterium]WNM18035.1 PASTA domain-containing protein [Flavobacterium sp. PMR2A8]WNM22087.1 PASTA domain-containing protein [Flavobacterium sp. PMTSA4]